MTNDSAPSVAALLQDEEAIEIQDTAAEAFNDSPHTHRERAAIFASMAVGEYFAAEHKEENPSEETIYEFIDEVRDEVAALVNEIADQHETEVEREEST